MHGSVDTLPHKGHKRMFFIHARRSLLAKREHWPCTLYMVQESGITIKRPLPTCHGPLAVVGELSIDLSLCKIVNATDSDL